jgi:hypothetical protein
MQTHAGNLRLFKYVPPERIDILENEKIAFTPPDRFKDPFEFRMGITRGTARNQLKELMTQIERHAELTVPGYDKLTSRQRRKGRKEMFRLHNVTEEFQKSFQDTVQTHSWQIGILCLCGINDSNLMWYHYADGHRGFVIEFDCKHESVIKLGKPWDVDYVETPPIFDHTKPTPAVFRFKPSYLKYEAERRILRPLSEFVPEKNKDGLSLYFRSLPRAGVKAVYFGHRMEAKVRSRIIELLNGHQAEKFDVIPSRRNYAFTFEQF